MLRVRDIMTHDIVSVASDAPLDVVAWRFAFEEVSGAPVRDLQGNLIGFISKTDLTDPARNTGDDMRVEDAMTRGVWAVLPDTPVLDAVTLMLEKGIHRVLVLDGPDKLVGIMTPTDVMRALVSGYFVEGPKAANIGTSDDSEGTDGEDSEDEDGESTQEAGASAR